MFESALGRSEASSTRLGTGAILSAGVHAFFAALVFIVPSKTKAQQDNRPEPLVIQIAEPKVEPGGPPKAAEPTPKKAEAPAPRPKPTAVPIQEKPTPEVEPKPQEPSEPTPAEPTGTDPNAATGTGDTGGGTGTGTGKGNGKGNGSSEEEKPTLTVLNWNASMERPAQIAGPAHPEYPRNALARRVEGTVIARCRIAIDGAVRDCTILSGDDMLRPAALSALAQQRYRPFMYGGVAVSVWYQFRFTFKIT